MKKISKLRVLKTTEYKGYHILIQNYGDFFQFIAFADGKFYQGFNIITPEKGKKKHNSDTLVKCGALMLDYAMTTVDVLLAKDNPEKLLEENATGAAVVKVLENANKVHPTVN